MPIHGYPGGVITANPTAPTSSVASGVWTTEQQLINQSAGRWPMAQTQISRSLRFNSADSAYLDRTFVGTPNTYTLSMWIKRSTLGTQQMIIGSRAGSSTDGTLQFGSNNTITVVLANTYVITTTAVYRDPSAWYHLVLSVTASGTAYLYINNVQVGSVGVGATCWLFNSTNTNTIGRYGNSASLYYDGYLTEVNFIDGLALDPSYFGFNDSNTGVWTPRQYTGAYGTNGFYLNFSDNSNTTAATLGKDYSGNGNNWTPNNFSVTAGAGNDSLVDSPTAYGTDTGVGGEVRGNYCTLNPLNKNTSGTLSNGNLEWQASTTAVQVVTGTSTIIPSGKTYFELNVVTAAGSGTYFQVGIVPPGKSLTSAIGNASGNGYSIEQNQADDIQLRLNGSSITVSTVVQTGDVLQVAVDYATGKLWFGRNNTWYNSSGGTTGNPAAGTNETATISTTTDWFPAVAKYNTGGSYAINFGQRAFAYTAPSGFKALCTQNLPTPTIGATSTTQAGKYFNPVLYTGTSTARSITGVGFQPDFTWIKMRSGVSNHALFDSVRGATQWLASNLTQAETTDSVSLTSFNSDGFSLGTGANLVAVNNNTSTFVAWNWNAGGSTVTNTSGTISAQVRANTTAGFSIITWTGNTTGGATIGHGLGVTPQFFFMKNRAGVTGWPTYHAFMDASAPQNYYISMASTDAKTSDSAAWNNTAPTSSVITLGSGSFSNGSSMVAYVFAPVAGYSAFGSYTGNGSADGPFVYLGFRPAFVLWKRSDGAESWWINDIDRLGYNGANRALFPNASSAEDTANNIDILSNGFKIRGSGGEVNASGGTYIYACFAENPFKYSLAR